jgi:hypothetical protein
MVRPQFLTRIVSFKIGCNLLGVLELLALPGLFIAAIDYVDPLSTVGARIFLIAGVVGLMTFDLWWRNGIDSPRTRWRFFSPFTGGSALFVPVWVLFAVIGVTFLAAVLFQLSRT